MLKLGFLKSVKNKLGFSTKSPDLYTAVQPALFLSHYLGLQTFCRLRNKTTKQFELQNITSIWNIFIFLFYTLSLVMTISSHVHFQSFDVIELVGRCLEIGVGFFLVSSVFVSRVCVKTGFVCWFENIIEIDCKFGELGVKINNYKLQKFTYILLAVFSTMTSASLGLHCIGDYYYSGKVNLYFACLLFVPFFSVNFHSHRYICSLKLLALRFQETFQNLLFYHKNLAETSNNLDDEIGNKVKRLLDIEIDLMDSLVDLVQINAYIDAPGTLAMIILTVFNLYYFVVNYLIFGHFIVDFFSYSIVQWLVYNQIFVLVFVSIAQYCQVN